MDNSWGEYLWHVMHTVALGYPDNPGIDDRRNYMQFYTNLQYVLPCAKCRQHYHDNLARMPIDRHLDSKAALFAWTISVHNIVNDALGKVAWTVEQALAFYTKNKGGKIGKHVMLLVLLIVIVAVLVACVYLKKRR